ncbi:MAG TPA: hypothetical protein VMU95_14670 [Trebonia sp.]|nr:hypothetical protein [Trebonia sp.]
MRKLRNAALVGAVALSSVAGVAIPAHAGTLKGDGCALHVSIAHPHAGQYENLVVKSTVAKTRIQVKIKYKTVSHTWDFTTGSNRQTTYRFGVGDPTKNYQVTLSGKVISAPRGYATGAACNTSFVPD